MCSRMLGSFGTLTIFRFAIFLRLICIFVHILPQGRLDAINIDNAVNFVISCMNFDGGFGCRPGSESHSG